MATVIVNATLVLDNNSRDTVDNDGSNDQEHCEIKFVPKVQLISNLVENGFDTNINRFTSNLTISFDSFFSIFSICLF